MDAVGDRDYIVEFLFWASLLSTHLRFGINFKKFNFSIVLPISGNYLNLLGDLACGNLLIMLKCFFFKSLG